jgi:hypothetical protein
MRQSYISYKTLDDAKPSTVIRQNQEKISEVEEYFDKTITREQRKNVEKTLALIKDFETPFGLELLGTLDFIFTHKKKVLDSKEVLSELEVWTDRKRKLFKKYHIDVAREKLLKYFEYN